MATYDPKLKAVSGILSGTTMGTKEYPLKKNNNGELYTYVPWTGGSGTDSDTKNTAGSTNDSSDQLFLIGAKTQTGYTQTYSNTGITMKSNCLTIDHSSLFGNAFEIEVFDGYRLTFSEDGLVYNCSSPSDNFKCEFTPNKVDIEVSDSFNVAITNKDSVYDNYANFDCKVVSTKGFYEQSDRTLKENIDSASDINKSANVEIKEFNFKSDTNKIKKYGVIAQEVEEAGLGNLVLANKDGIKSVDYISLLCLKVAELTKKNEELLKRIEKLEKGK